MNKTLVVFAAAGLLAPLGIARAQSSDVTLYGSLNVDVELVSGQKEDGSNPTVARVSSNSSRLGIKGSESLGGGLSAVFRIESSVFADTGGGRLAERDTYVGLNGDWGTVRIGNFLPPYDDIHAIFGNLPTLTTSILATSALWAQGTSGTSTGGFDTFLGNSVRFDSPTISGFRVEGQYSSLENPNHANIASLGGFYGEGPLQLGVAYQRNGGARGDGRNDVAYSIAGAYSFTAADIGGVYERLQYDTPSGSLNRDFWGLSVTMSAGPGLIYAFYGRASDGKGSASAGTRVGGLAKGADTSSSQWEISYTYPFSKRTLLYAGYVKLDNASQASYTFNINPYPVGIGGKPEGWVLGAVHFF